MIRRTTWIAAVLAATVTLVGAPVAGAAEPRKPPAGPRDGADAVGEARAHFRRGAELYRARRWRDAIAEFETAYRLKPHGAIHYNVAQCRERLGEWPAAVRAYTDYLREVPDARDRAAVRAAIGRLEATLSTMGVQTLLVYSDPPGAEVRVDGHVRGATPLHLVLPPGRYAVSVALDGRTPEREDVTLPPDASRVVDVALRPAPPPPPEVSTAPVAPVAPTAPATADLTPRLPDAPVPPAVPPPESRPPQHRRLWTWASAGVAAAALGAGVYYGIAARQKSDALLRVDPSRTTAQATALRDAALSNSRRANVLYGVAGAAGAAGVTLFFLEGRF